MTKTEFDLCAEAQPLREQFWRSRASAQFWKLLRSCDPRVRLNPPATEEQITELKVYAGGSLPKDLEDVLRGANGVGFDVERVLYSAEEIVRHTKQMRAWQADPEMQFEFMPFDHLFFIGDSGDGDAFVYGRSTRGSWWGVFWWEHETDSRGDCACGTWDYVGAYVSYLIQRLPLANRS